MSRDKLLWQASKVFAPDFPRAAADDGTMQAQRTSRTDFVEALRRASDNEMPGYYSVYSFPRGHPKHGNVPRIDTVFIDLDVVGDYQPNPNKPHYCVEMDAWRRSMSALLTRARMIAQAIIDAGMVQHFRVVLSGHKGLHLYLDLEEVAPENGDKEQFKNGLALYGETIMDWLQSAAGGVDIEPWVDVDASDLARLARHPNTIHHGAAYDDQTRWCVGISVEELAELTVDEYLDLTSGPRPLPDSASRVPSESAHDKLVQRIRTAASSSQTTGGNSSRRTNSDKKALAEYRENVQQDDMTLADVLFLTENKPCFEAFRERDDAYDHGQASRVMELSIMGRLISMQVPIDVIHEFFAPIPGYEEGFTNSLLADLLARDNAYGEFSCATIVGGDDNDGDPVAAQAPQFCREDNCSIYRRNDDLGSR